MTVAFRTDDTRFDSGDWTAMPASPPFSQRHLRGEKLIFCETVMAARGDCATAVDLIRGPWSWWHKGRSTDYRVEADGSSGQVLTPVWWYTTRIHLRILPPIPLPNSTPGVRLPIHMTRQFVGMATMDVIESGGGRLTICGRFHGVENRVPLIPLWMVSGIHLRAEAGTLLFPFPRGTGWRGLAEALATRY
jgi:hypothetical protein